MANYWLNDQMDHVIRVKPDKTVEDAVNEYAPEVYVETDDDGQILPEHEAAMVVYVESQGWEVMNGYSAQYGYRGPIMHQSEYVCGWLEDDILDTPGLYVVVSVETDDSDESAGWLILRKREDSDG